MPYIRIRKHYVHIPFLFLGVLECAIYAALMCLLVPILQSNTDILFNLNSVQPLSVAIFVVVMSCCTLAMGVYDSLIKEGFASMLLRSLASYFLLGSLAFAVLGLILPNYIPPQKYLFWIIIASFVTVVVARLIFVSFFDAKRLSRRILIFGAGQKANAILEEIKQQNLLSIKVHKCIAASAGQKYVPEELLENSPQDWSKYLKDNKISEIVIAQDERRRSEGGEFPLPEFLTAKSNGRDVTEAVSFFERELNRLELSLLNTSWMLYSDGFKRSKSRDWTKRVFDLVISLTLAILVLPLVIPTVIAIFLETGRPILYHQVRAGKNGKPFRIYKFRSMRQDAEKGGKAIWASKNDSRITRVGAFIRNTRLDELPQLYNVIMGTMSFVGPRPERPEFVEDLKDKIPYYDVRHTVKPGLMGWAQLKYPYGASVEDAKNKLQYDLYYTKNHSFLMDLLIMIQTVEVVLLGKGVH